MSISKILVSQNAPRVLTQYQHVSEKYGVSFDFRPFFQIVPLTSREFRAQRINFLDYTAVVFSSRHVIDAYFSLADELRTKIPETMKYFCTTEAVAMYLQKHIVYRKRKIFYGTGTPESVVSLIGPKHKGEKFLIASRPPAVCHRRVCQIRKPGPQGRGPARLRHDCVLQPGRCQVPQGKLPGF